MFPEPVDQLERRAARTGAEKAFDVDEILSFSHTAQGIRAERADGTLQWYQLAAAQDHAGATSRLGLLYLEGRGVGRGLSRAIIFIRRAAANGSADARFHPGLMHYFGYSARLDYAAALRRYLKAASNGHPAAMNNIGIMHGLGEGRLKPDDVGDYARFSLAAERGDENTRTNLEPTAKDLSEKKLQSARDRARTPAVDTRRN